MPLQRRLRWPPAATPRRRIRGTLRVGVSRGERRSRRCRDVPYLGRCYRPPRTHNPAELRLSPTRRNQGSEPSQRHSRAPVSSGRQAPLRARGADEAAPPDAAHLSAERGTTKATPERVREHTERRRPDIDAEPRNRQSFVLAVPSMSWTGSTTSFQVPRGRFDGLGLTSSSARFLARKLRMRCKPATALFSTLTPLPTSRGCAPCKG